MLRAPLGFERDEAPHAATISRALAGVPFAQLQEALLEWMAGVVSDGELAAAAAVDGKWAKQSRAAAGQPLAMVNVLAHDLKLCLAQWPLAERRYEPAVLRDHLGELLQRYPGLELLTMDALYAEQDLCQAIVSYGRDCLARVKGNRPAAHSALSAGFAEGEPGDPQARRVSKRGAQSR